MEIVLLGGSFVAGWTDEVVRTLDALCVKSVRVCGNISETCPPGSILAHLSLLYNRAMTIVRAPVHAPVVMCATLYDMTPPEDPILHTLLCDVAVALAPTPTSVTGISIRADPHATFARRLAIGVPGTHADALASRDVMPVVWGQSLGTLQAYEAPAYAVDTPAVLRTLCARAMAGTGLKAS